jgi:hypothetical protein
MAGSSSRRRASDDAEGSRTGARQRRRSSTPFTVLSRFLSVSDDPLCIFRLIQWNLAPAPAANPALPDDSSESYNYSPSRYDERDALRFKAERDETRRELEDVSKKAGIVELEWEHQRKQLLETTDGKFLD